MEKRNRFDDYYVFRVAEKEEADMVMEFIKTYWSETHILATDKEFLLYEYGNGSKLNILLAINIKTGKLDAIMGFYLYSMDGNNEWRDLSGGLLKVRPECEVPLLGVEMPKRLFALIGQRAYIGNGANPVTALPWEIRLLKHKGGKLEHYYRIMDKDSYQIAIINDKEILDIGQVEQKKLKKIETSDELYEIFDDYRYRDRVPYKDRAYIEKRYFKHPIYKYEFYCVEDAMVLIARVFTLGETSVFRIVDILGDVEQFAYIGKAMDDLLADNNYEYVDLYEHGMRDDILDLAGFSKLTDVNIIPNYFEPFVQKNIDIYFHTDNSDAVIFKADGDQDRPNHR